MSALLLESRYIMRGKQSAPREVPFAKWLYEERSSRGLTMVVLAGRAGVSHPRIVQLEKGDSPSRDMVARLASGLSGDDPDEHTSAALLNAGLNAAGFASVQPEPSALKSHTPTSVIEFFDGTVPPEERDFVLKLIERMGDARLRIPSGLGK